MPHPLLKSRENGATDEGVFVKLNTLSPAQITEELSNERLERAYFGDGLRKLGILYPFGQLDIEKLNAIGDALLRWSAFPGTSMYLCGSHGSPRAVNESSVHPSTFDTQEQRHTAILEAIGPVVWSEKFAYAMDVEAPGKVDAGQKRTVQAELIGRLRRRWPNLTFLCSTRNWSNPADLIGYELPADNCIARICFYEDFPFTHWNSLGLTEPTQYPTAAFGKAHMEKILRACLATKIPFVITEAGVYKVDANSKSAERWRADLKSVCYKLGVPLMEYALGYSGSPKGVGWGLGIGME